MAKIRVRITGYQRVFYSQVVEMDERTFRKADSSDGEGIDAIVGPLIDPTNVCIADEIEECEVERLDDDLPAEQEVEGMTLEEHAELIMADARPEGMYPSSQLLGRQPPPTDEEIGLAVLLDWLHAGIWIKRMLGHEPGQYDTHDPMIEDVAMLVAKAAAFDRLHGQQGKEKPK